MTIEPSESEAAHAMQDGPHEEDQVEGDQREDNQREDDQRKDDQRKDDEDGDDQHVCQLEIHFSVHMLHKNRDEHQQEGAAEGIFAYHLGPLQGYNRVLKQEKDDHAGAKGHKRYSWERTSSASVESIRGDCFEEQVPGELEKKLLRGWVERAEQWWERSSQPGGPERPPEEGLEEVDAWLRFIDKWDPRIKFESNKRQTLVFFFKERLEKDELFQSSFLGSASSGASPSSSSSSDPDMPKDRNTTRRSESPRRAPIRDRRKRTRSQSPYNSRIRSSRTRRKYEK